MRTLVYRVKERGIYNSINCTITVEIECRLISPYYDVIESKQVVEGSLNYLQQFPLSFVIPVTLMTGVESVGLSFNSAYYENTKNLE
jgi:hypothetical protein